MDWQEREYRNQVEGHKKIESRQAECFYCAYFKRCHTAVWREGNTCDLFVPKSK